MRVLLFSGTTEGRELSERLVARGDTVTVSVATEYGREEQAQVGGAAILTGRKSVPEMEALLRDCDLCVDATHPYALDVTENVKAACAATDTPYVRIRRDRSSDAGISSDGTVFVPTAESAADWLADREGNVLLATGAKELPAFRALPPERLFPRVLPSAENISACEAAGIPHRNIIAMQGPFTKELNIALLRQKDITFFVTKDGGKTGGFPEKAEAAAETGATLLVIVPPDEDGMTIDTFLEAYS